MLLKMWFFRGILMLDGREYAYTLEEVAPVVGGVYTFYILH